jgi:branched-subunit amino acid transport protein AzlD
MSGIVRSDVQGNFVRALRRYMPSAVDLELVCLVYQEVENNMAVINFLQLFSLSCFKIF